MENKSLQTSFDKMWRDLFDYICNYQNDSTNEYAIACCKDIRNKMHEIKHEQSFYIQ